MSNAAHQPNDRPLLRLFDPGIESGEPLTVERCHSLFRAPQLIPRTPKYRKDCERALAKWVEFEAALARLGQRITYPLPIKEITSSLMRAFQEWLVSSTCLSPSCVNKYVREILTTIALAGDDGHEVRTVRCRRMTEPVGAKIYLDEAQVNALWDAAAKMDWPRKSVRGRKGSTYTGTGLEPETFWRSLLVLLRIYGMRVQDLVAYEHDRTPVTWREICFDPRTPNPNGREQWDLGWFSYQSSKVGRQYYLPMTKYSRAAIDRLHAATLVRAQQQGLASVPANWPVYVSPLGGSLPRYWKKLCDLAGVRKPIQLLGVEQCGDKWIARTNVNSREFSTQAKAEKWLAGAASYVMEDFRSTAATFYAAIEESLPNKVCGWVDGAKVNVGRRNYINDEPVLLKFLPTAPMPSCFDSWLQ